MSARRFILVCLLVLCGQGTVAAAPAVRFATRPEARSVEALEASSPRPLSPSGGIYQVPGAAIRATCPGYDDMYVTFTWDDPTQHWHYRCTDGQGREVLPATAALGHPRVATEGLTLPFWKTARLNAGVSAEEMFQDGINDGLLFRIGGRDMRLRPLQSLEPGTVVIPNAAAPDPVYVVRPRFEPLVLQIPPGMLRDASVWPAAAVSLSPLYGPFSYAAFDIGLAVVLVGAGAWWLFILRPRAARRRREERRQLDLASRIVAETESNLEKGGRLPPLLGQTLATEGGRRFTILRLLGEGGMGAVFEATERKSGDDWAVKVLLDDAWDDDEFQRRFRREVEVCSAFTHPGLVKVLDWGLYHSGDRTHPFMIMERVTGEELRKWISDGRTRGMAPRDLVELTLAMLRPLGIAHAHGIIHRDLKPENIMITGRGLPKIMDFGLARRVDRNSLTRSDVTMGTPVYMSPEHVDAKRVTPASDVYSMGVILYEMLSGRVPFDGDDTWAILMKMLSEDPVQLSELRADLSPELTKVVMRMISRDTAVRYGDVASVVHDLQAALEKLP